MSGEKGKPMVGGITGKGFVKGRSGNPGGRPKALVEVTAAAQAHTPLAIETLAAILRNKRGSPSARVAAAVALLDRGWGKPTQRQEVAVSADLAGALEHFRVFNGNLSETSDAVTFN